MLPPLEASRTIVVRTGMALDRENHQMLAIPAAKTMTARMTNQALERDFGDEARSMRKSSSMPWSEGITYVPAKASAFRHGGQATRVRPPPAATRLGKIESVMTPTARSP